MPYTMESYDVAVIGAGHAGVEAALACARLGVSVILFTLTLDGIANMPCNPSIGGTAKGTLFGKSMHWVGKWGRLPTRLSSRAVCSIWARARRFIACGCRVTGGHIMPI